MGHTYQVKLTPKEMQTLGWMADRGYFPEDVYDAMTLANGEDENAGPLTEQVWDIPEHIAWLLLGEDGMESTAFLTCAASELASKIYRLCEEVV
jgi:hypothetical protein